jgi:Ca2+-binding RTX toxin-like protein
VRKGAWVVARRALLILCLLVPLLVPSGASAAHAARTGGGVLEVTGGSEQNGVTVSLSGGMYTITDSAGMDEGNGCSPGMQPDTSSCAAAPVTGFTADLGAGNDSFSTTAAVPVKVTGGPGNDNLSGGPMGDTLIGESSPTDAGTGQNTMAGGGGDDDVFGGAGPDNISGGPGADGVNGGPGADVVDGGDGNDAVIGGPGNDMMTGGPGDDQLFQDSPGAGGPDADTMSGGNGVDEATYAQRTTPVVVTVDGMPNDGGTGEGDNVQSDVEKVTGGSADDHLAAGSGPETLAGGPGNDLMTGGPSADSMSGGPGTDTADYQSTPFPVTVTLDGQPNDGPPGQGDNVQPDVENVGGGSGDDTFTGSDSGNAMTTGGGQDYADGGAGPDALAMGDGIDVARARDGVADTVDCGASSDFAIVDAIDVVAGNCERIDRGNSRAKLGRLVVMQPAGGAGRFALQKMRRRVPLNDRIGVPVGTTLDATSGSIRLTAAGAGGKSQTGVFSEGAVLVKQARSRGAFTELVLTGGNFSQCSSPRVLAKKVRRRLFGRAHGRFRSRGRSATATVRGTTWTMEDRCDGTLTTVGRGTVIVRDLVKHRTVTLHSGQRYLARRR